MAERDGEGEGKGFKVVDRRRFTAEGDERQGPDVPSDEEKRLKQAAAVAAAKQAPPSAAAPPPSSKQAAGKKGAPAAPQPPPPADEEDELESGLSFTVFLQSLAQQAMMQLGLIPMPHTGQRELQLEAARDTIDVLSLLKSKTKGNLTPQEEQLLEGVLYELRMTYVQINQQLAAQARQGPGTGPMPR